IYDPATDSWTTGPSLPTGRYGMGTGVISDVLYVVGGHRNDLGINVAATEALRADWSAKAPMPNGGRSDINSAVANGKLYVMDGNGGGGGNNTTIVEAYDPTTDSWIPRASKPSNQNSAATGVIGGLIYVAGGGSPGILTTTLAYDPVADAWSSKASMPTARV